LLSSNALENAEVLYNAVLVRKLHIKKININLRQIINKVNRNSPQ
jgi:hypothetical protein